MLFFRCTLATLSFFAMQPGLHAERLVLASASYGKNIVAICDADGQVLWSHPTSGPKSGHAGHHDIQFLDNGNILFHEDWTKVLEISFDKKVVWSYDASVMNGNKGKGVDIHAFQRLPSGLTMIAESGVGRIIEVDKDGKIHAEIKLKPGGTQHTRMVRKFDNGNYLVCSEAGFVTEYDGKGAVVWEHPIKTRVFGAIRLRSGNTLIATGGGNSVVEVNRSGKVVWEIKDTIPDTKIALKWTTSLSELDNGNIIVGNCHAGDKNPQIVEIARDKKVVWRFDQFPTFGNGLACSQVLNDAQSALVRQRLAAVAPK
jgi:outer membrane protein assembly factor BamB